MFATTLPHNMREHRPHRPLDATATDVDQSPALRRQADAEAYLRWKLDNRNNNGDNRLVDRDVTTTDADGQPPVSPASSTTERSSSASADAGDIYRANRSKGFGDAYNWLRHPDRYPQSDPLRDPDFKRLHPGWYEGYLKAWEEIKKGPSWQWDIKTR